MITIAFIVFVILCGGVALTREAARNAEAKNLTDYSSSVNKSMAHQGIGAVAIVVIILLVLALSTK